VKKPIGKCDVCNFRNAEYWFGRTSAATCGHHHCEEVMQARYEAHCEEVDKQLALDEYREQNYD